VRQTAVPAPIIASTATKPRTIFSMAVVFLLLPEYRLTLTAIRK
jgi:hypothetical protein